MYLSRIFFTTPLAMNYVRRGGKKEAEIGISLSRNT